MIAIIDYGAGNLHSVQNALLSLGQEPVITADRGEILSADHVILPGVGAFGDAMKSLESAGLGEAVKETARRGIPMLGICLGLQLFFEESEESPGAEGLGILPGKIRKIPSAPGLKIPHMGWNSLHFDNPGRLFAGIPEGEYVYFVHSYYLEAADPSIVTASTEYGAHIHASVESGNVFACQFHPEKSGAAGMKILRNFLAVGGAKC